MNLQRHFESGWNLQYSEEPPRIASSEYMAFASGAWARRAGIPCGEIKAGRGHKMIVNRTYILDYKDDAAEPKVSKGV